MATIKRNHLRSSSIRKPVTELDPKSKLFKALFDKSSTAQTIESLAVAVTDINEPHFLGHSAMHAAVTWQPAEVIRVIHRAGGRLDAKDKLGRTPMQKAEEMNNHDAIRELRRLSAEPVLKSA